MSGEDKQWLRRFITANLRLHSRPDAGLTVSDVAVSIGRPVSEVDRELRQMRSEGLVDRYEAGMGRQRRTRWYLRA